METLVSQTIGQKNLELCAIYLNKAIFLWTISICFYIGIISYSRDVLVNIRQNAQTSYYTQQFLLSYVPGLFLWGLCDLLRRYLSCFKKTFLPMMSYLISTIFHPLWCQIFVIELDMRLYGIAYAGLVTNGINFFLIIIFMYLDN